MTAAASALLIQAVDVAGSASVITWMRESMRSERSRGLSSRRSVARMGCAPVEKWCRASTRSSKRRLQRRQHADRCAGGSGGEGSMFIWEVEDWDGFR